MGFDGAPVPSAPPPMPACYQEPMPWPPLEAALETELVNLGLHRWSAELAECGMVSLGALKLVEDVDDLPEKIPKLAKKQLVKRAEELRSYEAQGRCPVASSQAPVGEEMRLTVKIVCENKSFQLTAHGNEKMGDVKRRFPSYAPQPNKICFNMNPVDDHQMLTDANVVDNSTLFLVPCKTGPVCLYAKTNAGAVVSVHLPLHETVGALRYAIARERNMPPTHIRLVFNSHELVDDRAVLQALDITENACIRVV